MEMTGEYRIEAPRDIVWEALNDPDILRNCIPGCEELEKTDDHSFEAKVKAKVGPVNAKFTGAVSLSNMNPPESYTISGEGKGGAAGFAKGSADVHLQAESDQVTTLTYKAEAKVGGKLAQLGSRLIDGTAQKMANEFFSEFERQVSEKYALSSSDQGTTGTAAGTDTIADSTPSEKAAPSPDAGDSSAATASAGTDEESATQVQAPHPGTDRDAERDTSSPSQGKTGLSPVVWIGGAAIIIVLLLILFV